VPGSLVRATGSAEQVGRIFTGYLMEHRTYTGTPDHPQRDHEDSASSAP
jgi:hypothetical protein